MFHSPRLEFLVFFAPTYEVEVPFQPRKKFARTIISISISAQSETIFGIKYNPFRSLAWFWDYKKGFFFLFFFCECLRKREEERKRKRERGREREEERDKEKTLSRSSSVVVFPASMTQKTERKSLTHF
jgi:hypothetical protein